MPSIIPGYEYDIFISYRQKDNRGERWVTDFVNALKTEIEATFKDDLTIYFDENPHDGLLPNQDVDASLASKLKCLIFIPIISQTYCDPRCFAWEHEFLAFKKLATADQFGLKVTLQNRNVASRILSICIHELDRDDRQLFENECGPLRSIDFIFKSPGVNRPLTATDKKEDNQNRSSYRDQTNKVANAIKEIIGALRTGSPEKQPAKSPTEIPVASPKTKKKLAVVFSGILLLALIGYLGFYFFGQKEKLFAPEIVDKSIAVLPFENMSGDPEQEYFSDGITEEILNSLAQLEGLKVTGRTSSFQFKGKNIDLKEVGEKLSVATVLEGSVRKQGDQLRITVQLISAHDGYHLWSQRFDRKVTDIFSIQDEIAQAVSTRLKLTLLRQNDIVPQTSKPGNQEAYDLYLKGRFFLNKRGESMLKAVEYFKQSVALDSTLALSHTWLGNSYALLAFYHMMPSLDGVQLAKKSIKTALRLDPGSADAYAVLGFMALYNEYDWDGAKQALQKAMQLNQSNVFALATYCNYLHYVEGNISGAMEGLKTASQLDPFWFVPYTGMGIILRITGKHAEGLQAYQKALEVNSNSSLPFTGMAQLLMVTGKPEEAIRTLEQGMLITGRTQMMLANLCALEAEAGKGEAALQIYNELNKKYRQEYVAPYTLAVAALAVGKMDEAFSLFNQAIDQKNNGFANWKYGNMEAGPKLKQAFQKDPRYQQLMNRLAFPDK